MLVELLLVLPLIGLILLGVITISIHLIKYLEAASAANQGILFANTLSELEIGSSDDTPSNLALIRVRDRVITTLQGYRHFTSDKKKAAFYFDNSSEFQTNQYQNSVIVTHVNPNDPTIVEPSLLGQTIISIQITLPEERNPLFRAVNFIGNVHLTIRGPYLFRRLE